MTKPARGVSCWTTSDGKGLMKSEERQSRSHLNVDIGKVFDGTEWIGAHRRMSVMWHEHTLGSD